MRGAMTNRLPLVLAAASVLAGCAPVSRPVPDAPAREPAPWSAAPLAASAVPAAYATAWRAADNRDSCALLAPASLPEALRGAAARRATFGGGWGVAYDLPAVRSASGVAGAGTSAWDAGVHDDWPHRLQWADGSRAGYGPEGGAGPNWLAYLRIPGQRCLYNVWSREGKAPLEALLRALRFVDVPR